MGMIFIGGVHAVGKGTLCQRLHEELGISSYSSSKLIELARNLSFSSEKNTRVNSDNQSALISMVHQKKALEPFFLLDGHFCLKGANGIEQIPQNVFVEMAPDAIIVLVSRPEVIQHRRKVRDGAEEKLDDISLFQNSEIIAAKHIAKKLCIPYLQADSLVDYDYIKKFVRNISSTSLS